MELRGIVDDELTIGLPGARELVRLGFAARHPRVDRVRFDAVAGAIGVPAAVDAAAVVANFQIMNRVVDATGLPIGRRRRELARPLIETLELQDFPHAQH